MQQYERIRWAGEFAKVGRNFGRRPKSSKGFNQRLLDDAPRCEQRRLGPEKGDRALKSADCPIGFRSLFWGFMFDTAKTHRPRLFDGFCPSKITTDLFK